MRYEFILDTMAVDDLRRLDANTRKQVCDALEIHLRHEPTKLSRSRIKRLRNLDHPQYRLRVDEYRVVYDVSENTVTIYGILLKSQVENWFATHGIRSSATTTDDDQVREEEKHEDDSTGKE